MPGPVTSHFTNSFLTFIRNTLRRRDPPWRKRVIQFGSLSCLHATSRRKRTSKLSAGVLNSVINRFTEVRLPLIARAISNLILVPRSDTQRRGSRRSRNVADNLAGWFVHTTNTL